MDKRCDLDVSSYRIVVSFPDKTVSFSTDLIEDFCATVSLPVAALLQLFSAHMSAQRVLEDAVVSYWWWASVVRVCGNLAPFASVAVCLSPLPTIKSIVRKAKVGNLPLLPYSTMVINSGLWFAYGLLTHDAKIWSCNGIGLLLGIFCLTNYIRFAPAAAPTLPGTVRQHIGVVLATFAGTVILIVWPLVEDPAWLIGKAGMVISVIMAASPLTVLPVVIETQSARSIPLPFTIAVAVSCFLWTVYGRWQIEDPNMFIPNALGLGFSLLQLALKVYYSDKVQEGIREFNRCASDEVDDKKVPLTALDKATDSDPPFPISGVEV